MRLATTDCEMIIESSVSSCDSQTERRENELVKIEAGNEFLPNDDSKTIHSQLCIEVDFD